MSEERKKAYLMMVLVIVIWGAGNVIIKYSLSFVSPATFLFWRFLITCWIFFPFYYKYVCNHDIGLKKILKGIVVGVLGVGLPLILFFEGLNQTTAIDASMLLVLSPLFVIAGGAMFLKEKVEKNEKIGISIAVLGTIITVVQPYLEGVKTAEEGLIGNVLILSASIISAFHLLYIKNRCKKYGPFFITASGFMGSLVLVSIFFFFKSSSEAIFFPIEGWLGILYMSILGSVVAFSLRNKVVTQIEASESAVFAYLQPLISVPLSYFWLKEVITLPFLVGGAVIVVGVIIAEFAKKKSKKIVLEG